MRGEVDGAGLGTRGRATPVAAVTQRRGTGIGFAPVQRVEAEAKAAEAKAAKKERQQHEKRAAAEAAAALAAAVAPPAQRVETAAGEKSGNPDDGAPKMSNHRPQTWFPDREPNSLRLEDELQKNSLSE